MVRFSQFQFGSLSAFVFCLLTAHSASAGLFCEWCIDPLRPYCSPAHQPTWGVHSTSWKQFPVSHSQYGDYCPQCEAGGTISDVPMQTIPSQVDSHSAIIIPQQNHSPAPMVIQPPIGSSGTVYDSNPQQMQFAPAQTTPSSPSLGAPVPLPQQSMPAEPTPMQNHLLPQPVMPAPMPANPQPIQPSNPPVPQPDNGASGPIPLPAFPGQAAVPHRSPAHLSSFVGNTPPISYGGYQQMARVPVYQQPSTVGAVPLIRNNTSIQTQRVPVTGVSFTQPLPQMQNETEQKSGIGRFMKMPRLPFFGK